MSVRIPFLRHSGFSVKNGVILKPG